jgi:hypothetical protein
MTVLRAHFDGKVLVPDEPVELPRGRSLKVHVEVVESAADEGPLARLAALAKQFPATGMPSDAAVQHDHYLYGVSKRAETE